MSKSRPRPNWLITPAGWCTRYGAVDELVAKRDDALVLLNGGDELTLHFSGRQTAAQTSQADVRDFFLFSVGWDKDADFHVLGRDNGRADPLPRHG